MRQRDKDRKKRERGAVVCRLPLSERRYLKMSAFVPEVQPKLRMLCRSLARIVQEYYKDPLHRAEFEKWHLEKYGEPYIWIPVNDASEVGK